MQLLTPDAIGVAASITVSLGLYISFEFVERRWHLSRHLRLDSRSMAFLEKLAARRDRPMSETAGQVFAAFEDFLDEIDRGSSLVIERKDGKRVHYGSPVLRPTTVTPKGGIDVSTSADSGLTNQG